MAKSMTGYGRHLITTPGWNAAWEIKSVNSRHLDLRWKTPSFLNTMLAGWEKEIKKTARRGKIDIFLTIQITDFRLQSLRLDQVLAKSMLSQLEEIAPHENWQADVSRFLNVPQVWKDEGMAENETMQTDLLEGLRLAMANWDQERIREGNELVNDLKQRHDFLVQTADSLKQACANLATDRFELLRTKIQDLAADIEISEERMLQELAILADRLDVSEELTRLCVHLKEILMMLDSTEEIGRKLDFLLQECFREINTCSNKAQNTDVSHMAVAFKAELEKCREQVQNLE